MILGIGGCVLAWVTLVFMAKRRDESVEVFRNFLMFLIVLGHMCLYKEGGTTVVSKAVATFGCWATDAFVLISGWYGVRFAWDKVIKFLGLGFFASLACLLISPLSGLGVQFRYSLGWFGKSYLGLLLFAPIINAAIDGLREKGGEKALRVAWGTYAVLMLVNWLPVRFFGVDLAIPGFEGLTFNTLLFVYVTGRVLHGVDWTETVNVKTLWAVFIGLTVVNYAWACAAGFLPGELAKSIFVGTKDYNSPLVLSLAVFGFLVFKRSRFPAWLGTTCAFLSPSLFSVYLIHEGCNRFVSHAVYNRYAFFKMGNGAIAEVATIVLAAILVFVACLLIDFMRRWAVAVSGNILK